MTGNGYNEEEMKMVKETHKIWGEPNISITATCIRVPIMRAHAESINLEFDREISEEEVSLIRLVLDTLRILSLYRRTALVGLFFIPRLRVPKMCMLSHPRRAMEKGSASREDEENVLHNVSQEKHGCQPSQSPRLLSSCYMKVCDFEDPTLTERT